jgi:DNA-binding CsgD family transcriptional regulator
MKSINKKIYASVLDDNSYFSLGVFHVLSSYFNEIDISLIRLEKEDMNIADVVFFRTCRHRYNIFLKNKPTNPVILKGDLPSHKHETERLQIIINMDYLSTPGSLLKKMRSLQSCFDIGAEKHCPQCDYTSLTIRELQVIRALVLGVSQKDIPEYLQINRKTVSSHKRAAMRKLGLKCNAELYYWSSNWAVMINSKS